MSGPGFDNLSAGLGVAADTAIVDTRDAAVQNVVTEKYHVAFHHFDHDVRGGVCRAVVVNAKRAVADVKLVSVGDCPVGCDDLGAQGFTPGHLVHERHPQFSVTVGNQLDHVRVAIYGHVGIGVSNGMVPQPVVTVYMRVEYGDYRLVSQFRQHAQYHFPALYR